MILLIIVSNDMLPQAEGGQHSAEGMGKADDDC